METRALVGGLHHGQCNPGCGEAVELLGCCEKMWDPLRWFLLELHVLGDDLVSCANGNLGLLSDLVDGGPLLLIKNCSNLRLNSITNLFPACLGSVLDVSTIDLDPFHPPLH